MVRHALLLHRDANSSFKERYRNDEEGAELSNLLC